MAVQIENNEKIIGAIMCLDNQAQRDIMFFIESTLAHIRSGAVDQGKFTSGKYILSDPNEKEVIRMKAFVEHASIHNHSYL